MRHAALALLWALLATSTPAGSLRQNPLEWKRSIAGHVVLPPEMEAFRLQLTSIRVDVDHGDNFGFEVSSVKPDGSFAVENLEPGRYGLRADATGRRGGAQLLAAAVAIVDVTDKSVTDARLPVQPLAAISGVIVIDGQNPPRSGDINVSFPAVGPTRYLYDVPGSLNEPNNVPPFRFETRYLMGPRRLVVNAPDGWILESAVLADRTDITDRPFTVGPGKDYRDVRVTLTDRCATIIAEVKRTALRYFGDDAMVTVFPEDRDKRGDFSRFVKSQTLSRDGIFEIKGLPPGETYLVAAHAREEWRTEKALIEWERTAARVYVDRPGVFQVKLGATPRLHQRDLRYLRCLCGNEGHAIATRQRLSPE
jgi:hypothetical protein